MTLRLMERWREHLEVEMDEAMIILAVAVITMENFAQKSDDPSLRDIHTEVPPDLLRTCNISSIAAATGINRETARRKVKALEQAGILITAGRGSVRLSPDHVHKVRTADLLTSQLQTLVSVTNDFMTDGIVEAG